MCAVSTSTLGVQRWAVNLPLNERRKVIHVVRSGHNFRRQLAEDV